MPVGTRIRDNNVFGSITDNPLAVGATVFNSNQLVYLGTVIGNHAVVTLDPIRQYGDPEIVIVTNHTGAATTATITRGAYGTTPRAHPQGTVWVHALIDEDTTEILTASTRPADPYTGQDIFEIDTGNRRYWNGTSWALFQEPDQYFTGSISNGTAVVFTSVITQNAILTLPYNYTMFVTAAINHGFNAVANRIDFQIQDESGVSINWKSAAVLGDWSHEQPHTGIAYMSTIIGKKDYTAGQVCGFRLTYKVTTSNVFMDSGVRVEFKAR